MRTKQFDCIARYNGNMSETGIHRPKHRSFRLTPPDNMHGMRVKPRIRRLNNVFWPISISVSIATTIGLVALLMAVDAPRLLTLLAFFGTGRLMSLLNAQVFKKICKRYALMTLEEIQAIGEEYPPIEWLEPVAVDDNSTFDTQKP